MTDRRVSEALQVLKELGMPRAQQNERSALSLLALLDLTPDKLWIDAAAPLRGITPIMDWVKANYGKAYAPNTRETFRRQTMHQFVQAGIAVYNPDRPERPVNSPKAVYQITTETLELLRKYESAVWSTYLKQYLAVQPTLAERYANHRKLELVPVELANGKTMQLSPGLHSILIAQIIKQFAERFAPGSKLVYAGDTGEKWGYFDEDLLKRLGVVVDSHGKMPDVVLYDEKRNWLLLVESVTSHGPMDPKRHKELADLFSKADAGLVYVTAFPNRNVMAKYLPEISWQTEVWVADAPTHLIHFNGPRFLGPYEDGE
jgi:hypothetical protein